jgi:D-inositol-3-phosphate glycosyltransferase
MDGQLKIAMLSIHSSPIGKLGTKDTGGMSVYIRELAGELGRLGHQIDVYTLQRDGDHRQVIHLHDNVRLIQLDIPINGNVSKQGLYPYLPNFFRALENFRTNQKLEYHLIHSHYWLSGLLGNWIQKIWQRPHMVMFHTLGAVKNSIGLGMREPEIRIAVEKKIVRTCHRIVAPTRRERERLMRCYGASAEKIGVVPCGVNLDFFFPIEQMTAREKLGFDPDDTLLLYVGRFEPLKGLKRLLEAMAYLDHRPRVRLLIIGGDGYDDPEFKYLRQVAADCGIEDKVVFAGGIEQEFLPPYYGSADALVIPSYYESFGLVGLEALACGRPVISTPVGAMEGLIRQNKTGQLVNDTTPQSLALGIESIISDAKVSSADRIRKSVLEYSWSNVASAIVEEYETLLGQQNLSDEASFSAGACFH